MIKKQYQSKRWVFTIPENVNLPELPPPAVVQAWLEKYAESAIFQKECGTKTGRLHYQGRLTVKGSRINKTGKNGLLAQLKEFGINPDGCFFETEFGEAEQSLEYCSKTGTRVDENGGPWRIGEGSGYLGKDLELELRPWQRSMLNFLQVPVENNELYRKVVVIHDRKGNSGKSWWLKKMHVDYPELKVFKLPTDNVDRLLSIVVGTVKKHHKIGCFVIDLTRTIGKDISINDVYHALEEIKSGYVVNTMYGKGDIALFSPPKVILLTNDDLLKEFNECQDGKQKLSVDRYIFLEISNRDKPIRAVSHHNLDLIKKYIPNIEIKLDKRYTGMYHLDKLSSQFLDS